MKDRNSLSAPHASREKLLHEMDKAFDESMSSLMDWLLIASGKGFLSWDRALEIFKEELKARRDHEC